MSPEGQFVMSHDSHSLSHSEQDVSATGGILLCPWARRSQCIATNPQFLQWRNSPGLKPATDSHFWTPIPPLEDFTQPQANASGES